MNYLKLKADLLSQLEDLLSNKVTELVDTIASAKESRNNDTKSSAGDKFETGREMMQIEINKSEAQLAKNRFMLHEIDKIRKAKVGAVVAYGSLVVTDKGIYLFGLAVGKVIVDTTDVYVLSFASPLGKVFLNKSIGDAISFNGTSYLISDLH